MQPEETVSRSPLEKPLHLLTEPDISQLTREDCRRYLIQKGMRRLSWNKSQAIQQVISLKSLLETTSHSGSRPPNERHSDSNGDEEPAANRSRDASKPDISAEIVAAENDSVSPPRRTMEVTNESIGQMTIFYSGEVSVFDDISGDKARIIMQLAASPLILPHAAPSDVMPALWPFASPSLSPSVIFPRMQIEGPKGRKASVQRYLEKRKGRFKPKKKVTLPSPSRLDVYLNRAVGDQIPNRHLNKSDSEYNTANTYQDQFS